LLDDKAERPRNLTHWGPRESSARALLSRGRPRFRCLLEVSLRLVLGELLCRHSALKVRPRPPAPRGRRARPAWARGRRQLPPPRSPGPRWAARGWGAWRRRTRG